MFMQLSGHGPAINGLRDYVDNVSVAARRLVDAIAGYKSGELRATAAPIKKQVLQPAIAKVPCLSDEMRLYRLTRGTDSVSPAIAAELNAIAARNRLN